MSLFKQFKNDASKENDGIEIAFDEAMNEDGTVPTFLVARMGPTNKQYQKKLESATRPYRRQIELQSLRNEIAEPLFMEVFVSSVLKGWKNVTDENGAILEFTHDNAMALMQALPDVYARLQEEAKQAANFREDQLKAEAGN